jgi:hypothetical protein
VADVSLVWRENALVAYHASQRDVSLMGGRKEGERKWGKRSCDPDRDPLVLEHPMGVRLAARSSDP